MKFKLIVKSYPFKGKEKLVLWIKKDEDLLEEIERILNFFEENISVEEKRRLSRYYVISSKNPAIILSLSSAIQDIVAEEYFL
jgi:hypothetical protein